MNDYQSVRTSMVLVAVGDRVRAYASIKDLPPDLRQRLLQSTSGTETVTLLIADRAGREAVLRTIRERTERAPAGGAARAWLRTWGAILLAGAAGLGVWLLATYR